MKILFKKYWLEMLEKKMLFLEDNSFLKYVNKF
jgi:hypothetical protein